MHSQNYLALKIVLCKKQYSVLNAHSFKMLTLLYTCVACISLGLSFQVAAAPFSATIDPQLPETECFKDPYHAKENLIQPDQMGYWKTVTQGVVPQSFQLKVIGKGPYPDGRIPGWSFTLFEALDADQIDIGGVHGMSGSPVYVTIQHEDGSNEDRLIGAYAYGFEWTKGKTPLWATPIEAMKELFTYSKELPSSNPSRLAFSESMRKLSGSIKTHKTESSQTPPNLFQLNGGTFPLVTSGVSQRVMNDFQPHCMAKGFNLKSLPMMGSATSALEDSSFSTAEVDQLLQPGGAVAAVLMEGDFFMGGIGTVTYREGNQILAMGHPILNLGTTRMPIMAAKILTMVNRYQASLKFGYPIGPIMGTFYQDRLAGLAGELGWIPEMVPLTIQIETPDKKQREYKSNIIQNRDWLPTLASMCLGSALDASSNVAEEQSYMLESTINLRNHKPLKIQYLAVGTNAFREMTSKFHDLLEVIAKNPFELPYFEKIECELTVKPGLEYFELIGASISTNHPKSGDLLELNFVVNSYQNKIQSQPVHFILPKNHPCFSKLRIQVATAAGATEITEGNHPENNFRSLDDLLAYLRNLRLTNAFYVQLLEPVKYSGASGNQRLSSSLFDYYQKNGSQDYSLKETVSWRVIDEKIFIYPAVCSGASILLNF